MCTVKYFTFKPSQISESVANVLLPQLSQNKIWCRKLIQSGSYRGIKIGVSKQDFCLVKRIIHDSKVKIESSKSLKDNNLQDSQNSKTQIVDKSQLNILFPPE